MRYLISLDSARLTGDELQKELARMQAEPIHRWAWTLETPLSTGQLLLHLCGFLNGADGLVVVDVTGRELGVGQGPDRSILPETGPRYADPGSITQRSLAAAFHAAVESPQPAAPAPAEPPALEARGPAEPEDPAS